MSVSNETVKFIRPERYLHLKVYIPDQIYKERKNVAFLEKHIYSRNLSFFQKQNNRQNNLKYIEYS